MKNFKLFFYTLFVFALCLLVNYAFSIDKPGVEKEKIPEDTVITMYGQQIYDPDPDMRLSGIISLERYYFAHCMEISSEQLRRIPELIVKALYDDNLRVAKRAVIALGKLDSTPKRVEDEYMSKLEVFLSDEDEDLAESCAYALGRSRNKKYVSVIVEKLKVAKNPDIRSMCAEALGWILENGGYYTDLSAVTALNYAVENDKNKKVVLKSLDSIIKISNIFGLKGAINAILNSDKDISFEGKKVFLELEKKLCLTTMNKDLYNYFVEYESQMPSQVAFKIKIWKKKFQNFEKADNGKLIDAEKRHQINDMNVEDKEAVRIWLYRECEEWHKYFVKKEKPIIW